MHTPTDKRVFYKEARTLAGAGYEVIHLAPGDEPSRTIDGVFLYVYRAGRRLRDRLCSLLVLYGRAAGVNADVYHCNEVDSWMLGIALKFIRRKVVVFDVHEHYPSAFALQHCPAWLAPTAGKGMRVLFRLLAPLTDYFVFAKRSVAPDFPGSGDRAIVVLNCAPLEDEREDRALPLRAADTVTAIHIGLFGRERGWPQLFQALRLCESKNLRIAIIGTCTDANQEAFQREMDAAELRGRVEVFDWLPYDEAYRRVERADIGLVLFQPGIQNHVFAMPHKMFDYMKARLPVIAPEFAVEIAPIVAEEDCGILVDSSSPRSIADALDRLAGSLELRRRLGENGRRAVFRQYNWERESRALLEMYERIAGRVARRRTVAGWPL